MKALSTVEVDISKVEEGKEITIMWRGKPVFIKRRTDNEVKKQEISVLEGIASS